MDDVTLATSSTGDFLYVDGHGLTSCDGIILIYRGDEGIGNRNGGWRVDYENVHAAGATPFSNECSGGVYVADRVPLKTIAPSGEMNFSQI